MHNDFNSDTIAGMAEAQQRHSGGMLPAQIEQQYSEIQARRVSPVVQYVPQQEDNESYDLSPAQVRDLKAKGVMLGMVAFCGSAAYIVVTGALNTYLGALIACAGGGIIISALRSAPTGGGERPAKKPGCGGSCGGCGCGGKFYQQNNFFG